MKQLFRPYNDSVFKPVVLSIAGFDPSGGAGVLADIKTFECSGVYGMAVINCNTFQNDNLFKGVSWLDRNGKNKNIALLAKHFPVKTTKLGMHKNLKDIIHSIKLCQRYFPGAKIIWDPVLASGSGFDLDIKIQSNLLTKIFTSIYLITPNQNEACRLGGSLDAKKAASNISKFCPTLLKGGHSTNKKKSDDCLYINGNLVKEYSSERLDGEGKHGSGCVLSAAISAALAKGSTLDIAINYGKKYVTDFLKSNSTLIGYHLN